MISVYVVRPEELSIVCRLQRKALATKHPEWPIRVARPDDLSVRPSAQNIIVDSQEYRQREGSLDPLVLAASLEPTGTVLVISDNGDLSFDDFRISKFRDLRPPRDWFHFLKRHCLSSEETRAHCRVLQENQHLSDSIGNSTREAMTRQILRISLGKNPRRLSVYRLLRMLTRVGNRAKSISSYFHELSLIMDDELLLGVVARFLQRCIAVQCGNRTYLKSQIADLIRALNRRHPASTLLQVLDFMRRSPFEPDATFGITMHLLARSGTARAVMFSAIYLRRKMSGSGKLEEQQQCE